MTHATIDTRRARWEGRRLWQRGLRALSEGLYLEGSDLLLAAGRAARRGRVR